jgi:hypothetical protein
MSLVSGTGDDLATMLYSKDSTSLTHISPMALNLELDNASSENGHPVFGGYATTTTELKALVQRVMRLKSSKLLFNSVHGRSSETKLITKSPSSLSPVVLKITEKKKKAESSQKKRFSNLKQFDRCPGKETIRLPKTVRFDQDLECVCFFDRADRPSIVGSSASYLTYDSHIDQDSVGTVLLQGHEWNISTPNFPHHDSTRKSMPVRVSRIHFSNRRSVLVVFVAVENLDFEKAVTCHFTSDYWKTVSETPAQYHRAASNRGGKQYDKFVASISFGKDDELDHSPFFFSMKYLVKKDEYWDNNSGMNFEVDFHKVR